VALAMSATLASAQGTSVSVEQRLQQLEAEQAAMKQQLAERDAAIQELKRELAAQGGTTAPVAVTTPAAPPAAAVSAAPPQIAAGQAQETRDLEATRHPTPRQVETWSVYDPGDGFLVGRSEFGELSVSAYAMARYMSQHDDDQIFTDHLGNERPIDLRNDIFSHRIMAFLKGWMGSEKLIYNITIWTVNTTDQDAIFANLGHIAHLRQELRAKREFHAVAAGFAADNTARHGRRVCRAVGQLLVNRLCQSCQGGLVWRASSSVVLRDAVADATVVHADDLAPTVSWGVATWLQ
jgi:hypothetical protein